ncbi:hypothetical protein F0U61_47245 [Archangium violaceum]|uniref:hypothetical protein n=1 Tax=Archangium violaceum TaxID=83451 RepID=UPI002B2B6840|nr:hypothetical protein F0U61_47245 [Archangium violaceum]
MDIATASKTYDLAAKMLRSALANSTARPEKPAEKSKSHPEKSAAEPKGHSTRDTFVDGPKGTGKASSDREKKIDKLLDADSLE